MKEEHIKKLQKAIYERHLSQKEIDKNERNSSEKNNVLRGKFKGIAKIALDVSTEINKEYSYNPFKLHILYAPAKPSLTISIEDKGSATSHKHVAALSFRAFLLNTIVVTTAATYKSTLRRNIIVRASDLENTIEDYIVTFYSEFINKY